MKINKIYQFYIGRFSSISNQEIDIKMIYTIIDPNGIKFIIYSNVSMRDIGKPNSFIFGTALTGSYIINLTIYCSVDYVNIGYAIVDAYEISGIEIDKTNKDDDKRKTGELLVSLPIAWFIGTIIFVGFLIGLSMFIILQSKKRNSLNIGKNP